MRNKIANTFLYINVMLISCILASNVFAEDRRTNRQILTIMTLNTEFMWDGYAPEEGRIDFVWKDDPTEAALHMQKIAEIILNSNPDIVHLVEVENEDAVKRLNADFLDEQNYKVYFKKGKDTYTGQDVALLTRIDPIEFDRDDGKGYCGDISKAVSKNLYATFVINDDFKMAIVGLHFLSRPNAENRRQLREAQADLIKRRAIALSSQGYCPIVVGDFNDYDGSPESRDHIDSLPVTSVLQLIREQDPSNNTDDLFNVAELVPKASRYTAFWDQNDNGQIDSNRELTSIDHVLVSNQLRNYVLFADIPHVHDPRFTPDHYPIIVQLRTAVTSDLPESDVKILSLLPNPPGSDYQEEEVALKNYSNSEIHLDGWVLRDRGGKEWSLDGLAVPGGQSIAIQRHGKAMSLNNDGDMITLFDPNSAVDVVTYGPVEEGEIIYH